MAEQPEAHVILQLNRIDELFNAPDGNPFSTHEVEILGEAGFDLLWKQMVRNWPRRPAPQRLIVQLPLDQLTSDLPATLCAALQRYCAAKIADNQWQRRLTVRKSLRLMLLALGVTLFAIAAAAVFFIGPLTFLPVWLRGLLTVLAVYAAAVAIWDALDSLIFDWPPFVRDNATYRFISAIEVVVEPLNSVDLKFDNLTGQSS